MKRLAALLLLAGCEARTPVEPDSAAEDAAASAEMLAAENASAETSPEEAARIEAAAVSALGGVLIDPPSARYANVRKGSSGSICGQVDAKQESGRHSGFRPFVVTPDGIAIVSTSPQVSFGDPADLFPDIYIRWCASPEELSSIGPRIALDPNADAPPVDLSPVESQGGIAALNPDNDSPAGEVIPEPETPAAPGPPPPRVVRPNPEPTTRLADDDSFFNAVMRARDEQEKPKE